MIVFAATLNAQVKVYVHLDTAIHSTFTGRLLLHTQSDTTKSVGDDNPAFPQVSFAMNVQNWQPGQVQVFTDASETDAFRISELKPGYYRLAAVVHVNTEERTQVPSPGNAYSRKESTLYVPENKTAEAHVYINTIFKERPFRETPVIKRLNFASNMLSKFHKKEIAIKAAVILPDSNSLSSGKRYPVVFVIPGWGGTHYDALNTQSRARYGMGMGKEKIYVYLNPETQTRWGLHAFVDSDVNGPWGKALVEELIPYLKQNYPVAGTADQYFVMGQSSGGYGAAWLQLHYPDAFNGCWAVSPDPVDFSNFIGVNIYAKNENMLVDENGKDRGLFLNDGKPITTIRRMTNGDEFTGPGGQLQSFEAEFGKTGPDGVPRLLFNRKTGVIDPSVVNDWKRYDLALYVQQHWGSLSKKLTGKVHIYAGGEDNFYLNKAVEAFVKKAASVNASITAETIPGANHWSIWSPTFTQRVQKEIDARIR